MVHALQETWRVTRSTVLDIRPIVDAPRIGVKDRVGQEKDCGSLKWSGGGPERHAEATAAVSRVVEEGSFTIGAARQFEWVDSFEDVDELVATVAEDWESWSIDEDASLCLMQAMEKGGRGAVPLIRQGIRAQVLKKVGV